MASNNIIQTATGELLFSQDGKMYNLYKLPKNFVINGDLDISGLGLTKLPNLSTVTVTGNFNCANNNLTSLRGAPHHIGKNFSCRHNAIRDLMYMPSHIGDGIDLSENNIFSLNGAPEIVNGFFFCSSNSLVTLLGGPKIVKSDFDCSYNQLATLSYAPVQTGKSDTLHPWFDCSNNLLKSLDGAPKSNLSLFRCDNNSFDKYSAAPPHISKYELITGLPDGYKSLLIANYRKRKLNSAINKLSKKIQNKIEPVTTKAATVIKNQWEQHVDPLVHDVKMALEKQRTHDDR